MKYVVVGPLLKVGPGQKMRLSAAQIDARAYGLELVNVDKGDVCATRPLEFKCGEVIDLKEALDDLPAVQASVLEKYVAKKPEAVKATAAAVAVAPVANQATAADLDALEKALEDAEAAYHALTAGVAEGQKLTAEQQDALDAMEAARSAFNDAIGAA